MNKEAREFGQFLKSWPDEPQRVVPTYRSIPNGELSAGQLARLLGANTDPRLGESTIQQFDALGARLRGEQKGGR